MKSTILVVDDEPSVRESLIVTLEDDYDVIAVGSGQEALELISKSKVDLVLLDILMPDKNGIETLRDIRMRDDELQVIMLTAVNEIQKAVESIKLGAFDYLTKPYKLGDLKSSISRALKVEALQKENIYLRAELEDRFPPPVIIGKSSALRETIKMAKDASKGDSTVLITGETGTGKELLARLLWQESDRASQPFVVVNCTTIPQALIESELFGHEKGVFTSADRRRVGKLELASTGTAFLDEVSALSLDMQMTLLRVLQEKTIERVGGHKIIPVDVRFIAATNVDLRRAVDQKTFRDDLYYRLNVIPITIPPLRQRIEDIPLLVDHFFDRFNRKFHRKVKGVSKEVMNVFLRYHWPGNIRELENLIERLTVLSAEEVIPVSMIPHDIVPGNMDTIIESVGDDFNLRRAKRAFEKDFIERVLIFTDWNIQEAANLMGVNRSNLFGKIKGLGISK